MKFNFDNFIDRKNTLSLKWDKHQKNVIPLWIADTDFLSPPCMIKKLNKRIKHGIFGYTYIPKEIFEMLQYRMKKLYDWKIKSEWIVYIPNVVFGLNMCVSSFTNKKQSILLPIPIYPPFIQSIKIYNRNKINIPLFINNKRWIIDINNEKVNSQLQGNEKLLMLCNPHNPVGTVYKKNELQKYLHFAQKHDLIVCSDEIHSELILEKNTKHIPFASLSEDALQRTITLISPSKTFNIPGLGLAFAIIANNELRKIFKKKISGILPNINILSLIAVMSVFDEGEEWLKYKIQYLRKNRDILVSFINKTKMMSMFSPEATYLGWINIKKLKLKNPCQTFEKYGLGLSPGKDFGINNFIRLNFGCSYKLLQKVLKRIELFLYDFNTI